MFKAVITTVVMALSEKQKNCSSDKTTTVCGDSSESLQLPTKPHSRGCESTYNKVLFTPPTMCRLTNICKRNKLILKIRCINSYINSLCVYCFLNLIVYHFSYPYPSLNLPVLHSIPTTSGNTWE